MPQSCMSSMNQVHLVVACWLRSHLKSVVAEPAHLVSAAVVRHGGRAISGEHHEAAAPVQWQQW
jgi:hypothetical protein